MQLEFHLLVCQCEFTHFPLRGSLWVGLKGYVNFTLETRLISIGDKLWRGNIQNFACFVKKETSQIIIAPRLAWVSFHINLLLSSKSGNYFMNGFLSNVAPRGEVLRRRARDRKVWKSHICRFVEKAWNYASPMTWIYLASLRHIVEVLCGWSAERRVTEL